MLYFILLICVASSYCFRSNDFNQDLQKNVLRAKTDEQIYAKTRANYELIGDVWYPKSDSQRTSKSSARLWPLNTLPFIISDNVTDELRQTAYDAMRYIKKYSCVQFRHVTDGDKAWITFMMDPRVTPGSQVACSAFLGFQGEPDQPVLLTSNCPIGRMVHELLHTLGFNHEHSRADRNKYIKMIDENLPSESKQQYQIECNSTRVDCQYNTYGVPYNYESIMHYCDECGSFGPGVKSFIILNNTDAWGSPQKVGQRDGFSRGDWIMLNRRHNCPFDEGMKGPEPLPDNPDKQRPSEVAPAPTRAPGRYTTKKSK